MSTPGEHEIEPHPHGFRRALVAGCVAVVLLLLGLIAGAHAETDRVTPNVAAWVTSPSATVMLSLGDRHRGGGADRSGLWREVPG
jgi:hypothetical protein